MKKLKTNIHPHRRKYRCLISSKSSPRKMQALHHPNPVRRPRLVGSPHHDNTAPIGGKYKKKILDCQGMNIVFREFIVVDDLAISLLAATHHSVQITRT